MSKSLYIIGNGFDRAHGLKTSYWDFRTYLEENHWEFLLAFEKLYDFEPFDEADPYTAKNAKKLYEDRLQQELWSQLEENIGHPNIVQMENFSDCIVNDLDLESGNVGIRDTLDEYWRNEYGFIKKLQEYIKEWIEALDTSRVVPRKKSLINCSDHFLSFNYTDTLERVYGIEDVYHIHGGIDIVSEQEPIIGHCNKKQIKDYRGLAKQADEAFDEGTASIDDAIADYLELTYKDTDKIILFSSYFWESLADADQVVIIGWSAGAVDMPYLKEIASRVQENAKWTVCFYNVEARDNLTNALQYCGIDNSNIRAIQTDTYWDC